MTGFWRDFSILNVAALFGAIALTPYSHWLLAEMRRPLKFSPRATLLMAFGQNAVLFAIVVAVGLLATLAVGLDGHQLPAATKLTWPIILGSAAGLAQAASMPDVSDRCSDNRPRGYMSASRKVREQ